MHIISDQNLKSPRFYGHLLSIEFSVFMSVLTTLTSGERERKREREREGEKKREREREQRERKGERERERAVSYTHLTLPTTVPV